MELHNQADFCRYRKHTPVPLSGSLNLRRNYFDQILVTEGPFAECLDVAKDMLSPDRVF